MFNKLQFRSASNSEANFHFVRIIWFYHSFPPFAGIFRGWCKNPGIYPIIRVPRVLPIFCQFIGSLLASNEQLMESGMFEVCQFHCLYFFNSLYEIINDGIPVWRFMDPRSSKDHTSTFRRYDPLRLSLSNVRPLLSGNCSEYLNQDVVDYFKYPCLILRNFHQFHFAHVKIFLFRFLSFCVSSKWDWIIPSCSHLWAQYLHSARLFDNIWFSEK